MVSRTTSALVSALATLLFAEHASAAEIRIERSKGAEACPDPAALEARARESAKSSSRDVDVRFARTRTGYASSIRTSDGMVRAIEDAACDALADATLVIVRLALDVESASPEPASSPPSPAPAPAPAPASTTTTTAQQPKESPQPSPNDPRKSGVELLAGGAVSAGLGVSFGKGVRAGASWLIDPRWSIGVTGLALAPETRSFEKGTVEIGVLGGGLEGCGRAATTSGAIAGALCARGEMFRLSGAASGFARNEEHARPLPTMGLALRGKLRIVRPVGAFAEVAASVPLARERFAIDGAGIIYDPPVVAGSAAAGLSVDFE